MMSSMQLTVHRSLDAWAEAWDRLVDVAAVPSPFLRSWWLTAVAGDRPTFLIVADGDDLVGGAAFDEHRFAGTSLLRVMGDGALAPDHTDLVATPGREDAVVAAVAAWLRRPGSRVIDLAGLPDDSLMARALPSPRRGEEYDEAFYAAMPLTFDDFLASMPPIMRNSIRRARRRFENQGAHIRPVGAPDVERALDTFHRLHDAQWRERSTFLDAFSRFSAAARAGTDAGELRILEMWQGDRVVASDITFEVAGRMSYYQGGRDMAPELKGAGTVLMAANFERAIVTGMQEVDLLRGGDPYKRQWASTSRRLLRLQSAHGAHGIAALGLLIAKERAGADPRVQRARAAARRRVGRTA